MSAWPRARLRNLPSSPQRPAPAPIIATPPNMWRSTGCSPISTPPARRRMSSFIIRAIARAGRSLSLIRPRSRRRLPITAFGGFLVGQAAAKRMLPKGHGAILFTGASASVKGYAQSAPFAMGKFALRGLAQSMARELQPQGIHVAHFVIDGGIKSARRPEPADRPDSMLDPDAIAATYLQVLQQPRSAWSQKSNCGRGSKNFRSSC